MKTVTEQQIIALAPNPNAVANARKISAGGGFLSRMRSADDTFYMGECKGSGKSSYIVSADFIQETAPVFRCSCPSRQFPCKHSLALLFEMLAGKPFAVGEIPEDIVKKREKKDTRAAKKAAQDGSVSEQSGAGGETAGQSEAGGAGSGRKRTASSRAARTKKIKKQLEGLALIRQLTGSLVNTGLAAMGGVSLKTYRDLARQLGDYYLPGPQVLLNRLILEMEAFQKDQDTAHYHTAAEVLKRLHALDKKAVVYLEEKLEKEEPEADDDELYEELGGIWKLDQLNALGLKREEVHLIQLSFQVDYDEARKEFVDLGWWAEADTGDIFRTLNYRPLRALKYVKQEDSCFALLKIPVLFLYPGARNRRVRWEQAQYLTPQREVFQKLRENACTDIASAVKAAKNQIKNTLSEDFCAMLLPYKRIGTIENDGCTCLAMEDDKGSRIILRSRRQERDSMLVLARLSEPELFQNQVMFGLVYYDPADHKMCVSPLSIVTGQGILRLLY